MTTMFRPRITIGNLASNSLFIVLLWSAAHLCSGHVASRSVELHAEPLAIGAAFTFPSRTAWSAGVDVSLGKYSIVNVTDDGAGIDTYVTGYLVVKWIPVAPWQIALSPVGFAAVAGNDFGVVYPSARAGVSYFWKRVGVGTELRVVRIASSFGSGDYWIQWAPIRVGVRL